MTVRHTCCLPRPPSPSSCSHAQMHKHDRCPRARRRRALLYDCCSVPVRLLFHRSSSCSIAVPFLLHCCSIAAPSRGSPQQRMMCVCAGGSIRIGLVVAVCRCRCCQIFLNSGDIHRDNIMYTRLEFHFKNFYFVSLSKKSCEK